MRDVAVPRIDAWADGETLAFDREMRSLTLTVLTRTLLSSDMGAEQIGEIESLLHVLLAELIPDGIIANIPALAWVPTRSNRRFEHGQPAAGGDADRDHRGLPGDGGRSRRPDVDPDPRARRRGRHRDDRPATPGRGDNVGHRRLGDDGQHDRVGLLPADPASGHPGAAAAGSGPGAGRPGRRLRRPGAAPVHPGRGHRDPAAVQPGVDPAAPGCRRGRAGRPPAAGQEQDPVQPVRAQPGSARPP